MIVSYENIQDDGGLSQIVSECFYVIAFSCLPQTGGRVFGNFGTAATLGRRQLVERLVVDNASL